MVKIHEHVKFQANPSMHSPANARKPLRTDGRTDGRTDRRTDGRTDGKPENIMPPAPKGGGIIKWWHFAREHCTAFQPDKLCGGGHCCDHAHHHHAGSSSRWWAVLLIAGLCFPAKSSFHRNNNFVCVSAIWFDFIWMSKCSISIGIDTKNVNPYMLGQHNTCWCPVQFLTRSQWGTVIIVWTRYVLVIPQEQCEILTWYICCRVIR